MPKRHFRVINKNKKKWKEEGNANKLWLYHNVSKRGNVLHGKNKTLILAWKRKYLMGQIKLKYEATNRSKTSNSTFHVPICTTTLKIITSCNQK